VAGSLVLGGPELLPHERAMRQDAVMRADTTFVLWVCGA
jgi:hypothetical protein